MANFRAVLALQMCQHIFFCGACLGAQLLSEKMKLHTPGFVVPSALGAAGVTAIMLWSKQTRWPLNMLLVTLFTVLVGLCLAVTIIEEPNQPTIINATFQVTSAVALLLAFSFPSFCCDTKFFDVKYYGYFGYLLMLLMSV